MKINRSDQRHHSLSYIFQSLYLRAKPASSSNESTTSVTPHSHEERLLLLQLFFLLKFSNLTENVKQAGRDIFFQGCTWRLPLVFLISTRLVIPASFRFTTFSALQGKFLGVSIGFEGVFGLGWGGGIPPVSVLICSLAVRSRTSQSRRFRLGSILDVLQASVHSII